MFLVFIVVTNNVIRNIINKEIKGDIDNVLEVAKDDEQNTYQGWIGNDLVVGFFRSNTCNSSIHSINITGY